jgi:hypothetical protein
MKHPGKDGNEEDLQFGRLPKKLIQLRLDPVDVKIIDRESKRTTIDRAQLVRSWVRVNPNVADLLRGKTR